MMMQLSMLPLPPHQLELFAENDTCAPRDPPSRHDPLLRCTAVSCGALAREVLSLSHPCDRIHEEDRPCSEPPCANQIEPSVQIRGKNG